MPDRSPPRTDTASRVIAASPHQIYEAFIDPQTLMRWLPPSGMTGRVLLFEPWEGGRYRIELAYGAADRGKTTNRTDVSNGRFLTLEPGERIVQSAEFESDDPRFSGEMIMSWGLEPVPEGSKVTVKAENVPAGISKVDHAAGMSSSLDNLARFVERVRPVE